MNSVRRDCLIRPILVFALMTMVLGGELYSYDDQDLWPQENPLCGGKQQSPINIKSSQAIVDESLTLQFKKYDEPFYDKTYTWVNDGRTLKLTKNDLPDTHLLSGRAVDNGLYKFKNLHMNWGNRNDFGSEHSVDGIKYPVEVHLVHEWIDYNYYPANKHYHNNLAVLCLFFVIGKEHFFFKDLVRSVHDLTIENKPLDVWALGDRGIIDVLPNNLESYFVYNGSLTTPLCNETVKWIVFKEIQELSEEQLNAIRNVFHFTSNSRHLQQSHQRPVFSSDSAAMEKNSPLPSSSQSRYISINLVNCCFLAMMTLFRLYFYQISVY